MPDTAEGLEVEEGLEVAEGREVAGLGADTVHWTRTQCLNLQMYFVHLGHSL